MSDWKSAWKTREAEAHQTSRAHGFWEDLDRAQNLCQQARVPSELQVGIEKAFFSQRLRLIGDEVAEAHEVLRSNSVVPSEKTPGFDMLEEELADVVIRIMDLAHRLDLRMAEAIDAKLEYNKGRPFKHGKAF